MDNQEKYCGENMNKFKVKVGDLVRVVSSPYESVSNGSEGTVLRVFSLSVNPLAKVSLDGHPSGLNFYFHELEILTPTLESRVSALEENHAALLKLVTEMDDDDAEMEEKVRALEAAVFVASVPPSRLDADGTPIVSTMYEAFKILHEGKHTKVIYDSDPQPEVVPWEAVEVRWRSREQRWFAPAIPVADVAKNRGYYNSCDIRDSRTGRVMLYEELVASACAAAKAKPLTRADVEYKAPGGRWKSTEEYYESDVWLDGWPYTANGWKFRNKHTHEPIAEAEFRDICLRERDEDKN